MCIDFMSVPSFFFEWIIQKVFFFLTFSPYQSYVVADLSCDLSVLLRFYDRFAWISNAAMRLCSENCEKNKMSAILLSLEMTGKSIINIAKVTFKINRMCYVLWNSYEHIRRTVMKRSTVVLYFKTTHGTKKMWSYITGGLKIMVI